jgi:hypothetical protein
MDSSNVLTESRKSKKQNKKDIGILDFAIFYKGLMDRA